MIAWQNTLASTSGFVFCFLGSGVMMLAIKYYFGMERGTKAGALSFVPQLFLIFESVNYLYGSFQCISGVMRVQ